MFTVNSTGDGADSNTADNLCNDGAGNCTLRAAIQQANVTVEGDTIGFSVTGTINLTGQLPNITNNLTVNGPGSSLLTVRRHTGGDYRIFTIYREESPFPLFVRISGLTVTNGRTPAGAPGEFPGNGHPGGGLTNGGTLTLTDVTLTGNSTGAGGAGGAGGDGGSGGAIYNTGTLTMTGCVVKGNSTGGGGESVGGRRGGDGGDGGGIFSPYVSGALTMSNCTVSGNTTGAGGGGGSGGEGGSGAGIYGDTGMTLTGVTVSDNAAGGGGDAPLGDPGFGGHGGGIYLDDGNDGLMMDSTVSGNRAGPGQNGKHGRGGGVLTVGDLTVLGCTISGNSGSSGGAITNMGMLTMANTTISGNRLNGSGGAVQDYYPNITRVTNCTITDNEGPGFIAGRLSTVGNSIIAGNGGGTGLDVSGIFNSQGFNIVGRADGASGFTEAGDRVGTAGAPINPRLGPLADNGGPTLTHALLAGSPALDSGFKAIADDIGFGHIDIGLTTDQRGTAFTRFADSADVDDVGIIDVGAFEAHPSVEDVTDKRVNPGASLSFSFNVGDASLGISSVTAASNDQALVPDANLLLSGSGSARTLRITPAANLSGTATITLTVTGSNGRSMSDTFVLRVSTLNAAPAFTKGTDQTVVEDSGPQTITGWATGIGAGSPGEAGQSVSFVVTGNTNPGLFSAAPSVSPGGTLTFTPAPDANGSAAVTLVLRDDGGTADGGQDTSAPQTFNVNVTAVNDVPVNSVPGPQATDQNAPLVFSAANANAVSVADVDAGSAPLRVTLTATRGTLTIGSLSGLTFAAGDGANDAAVTFAGPVPAVNAALGGLVFKPEAAYSGLASLEIRTTDQGFASDTDFVPITVRPGTVEFTQSAYTAAEGAGSLTVTVRRTGDTSTAASVDYATDDGSTAAISVSCSATTGIALDRCDFTKALGRLALAPGETEKTISLLVGDDSYVEGPETALIRLSNVSGTGVVLGSRTSATLQISDDAPESSSNPADDSGSFVRQHYHDFLNREPDAGGLAFWTGEIESCGADAACREVKRVNVSAAFFLSIEFQETGFLVYRLDKVAFGDLLGKPVPLTLAEFLADTQDIGRGVIVNTDGWERQLEDNKRAFADAFVARPRFLSRYPAATTPEAFVDSLNANAVGVLSQEERDALVAQLKGGAKTRAEVLRAVAEHPALARRESNRAFVLMQFFGYLRRDPDSAPDSDFSGYSFWLGKLNEFNGNYIEAELVKAFISSDEYRRRFGL